LAQLAEVDAPLAGPIKQLACGFRSCSVAGREVEIDVLGFASSREFSCDGYDSDQLNLKLAEARRQNVIALLQPADPSTLECRQPENASEFHIFRKHVDARWNGSIVEMEDARRFEDRVAGDPNRSREIFTRRVDILIRDKGDCAVVE
jgi:hypothetical protein